MSEAPFDAVILATGYRAAVGLLGPLIRVDQCGFARRRDRVASDDHQDLYFVGHNYGIQGGLYKHRPRRPDRRTASQGGVM
jgi:lysine/ornithine N-monooxygenase